MLLGQKNNSTIDGKKVEITRQYFKIYATNN